MPFVKLYYKLRVDISKIFANYFLIGIPKYKYSTKNGTEPSQKILGKNIFLTFLNFVAQFGTNFSTIHSKYAKHFELFTKSYTLHVIAQTFNLCSSQEGSSITICNYSW